jgi:hypothetical protein
MPMNSLKKITLSIVKQGLVPIYWENEGTGNKSMGIFN